ncbi:MAG TPA: DUF6504 family protein [Candidatus Baltobacteraceae bacterium]|jgi:hypothetical protein|nr:DUF6504 family protein [Candidatus Baltobacteraceae bacterium]
MGKQFVSEPLVAVYEDTSGGDTGYGAASDYGIHEPQLPRAFRWRNELIEVRSVRERRRSTKVDRGDTYLKRHWFEFETTYGRIATVYYDRSAKRSTPHWWLYSLSS